LSCVGRDPVRNFVYIKDPQTDLFPFYRHPFKKKNYVGKSYKKILFKCRLVAVFAKKVYKGF
jgi:hypothetical protein